MRNGFRLTFTARTSRALSSFLAPALLGLTAFVVGCGGSKTTPPPAPPTAYTVDVTNDNNFSSVSSLTIPPVKVPAQADLHVCWTGLTSDIQGHAVDPTKDINDVSFIKVVSGSASDTAELLNEGKLDPKSNINGDFEIEFPTGTGAAEACVDLSKLVSVPAGPGATPLDPKTDFVTDSTITYLMVFATGTQIGLGARMMVILQTDPSATSTNVDVTNTSATLSYKATLSAEPVSVTAGKVPVVDWSAVTQGGAPGQTVGRNDVSRVLVGFYAGATPADLEKNFLNLAQPDGTDPGSPTKSWEVSVSAGTSIDLALAKDRSTHQNAFTGFTTETGSWVMGMFCDQCQNPAPLIVTLADPQ